VIPSQHAHTIHGGSGFSQNYTFNALRASSCSDCEIKQDMSERQILRYTCRIAERCAGNYWFPKLYFHDPKTGLFEDVPNGGLLVTYKNSGAQDKANGGPGLKVSRPGACWRIGS
jgi:hypothetical protein